jgi:acetoin utilization protein AcuB
VGAVKAADVMIARLVTGTPEMRLYQALELMEARRIRHLPIVADGRLVGLISDRDIKLHVSAAFRTASETVEDRATLLKTTAEVMTRAPYTVSPDAPLAAVVRAMIEKKYGAVPVVDGDQRPVGIVTQIDLLRLLLPHVDGAPPDRGRRRPAATPKPRRPASRPKRRKGR